MVSRGECWKVPKVPKVPSPLFRRKRAVVHIGTHKTGTTSFQKVLHESRARLDAQGILLATDDGSALSTVLAHLVIRGELQPPFRLGDPDLHLASRQREFSRHIRKQVLSDYPVLIFSHEALSFVRTTREIRVLKKLLFPRKVRIVVAVRNPKDFLQSFSLQFYRTTGWETVSEFESSLRNTRSNSWLANFDELLRVYVAGFGKSNVTVVDYDHELRVNGDVVPSVWEACGLPSSLMEMGERAWENRTPPA